ncbi:MAG: hypothetical protein JXR37_11465 [Kiritimatiellae bacterium]|nr:hypothetical protein [Kiritimatiellia bacterium]
MKRIVCLALLLTLPLGLAGCVCPMAKKGCAKEAACTCGGKSACCCEQSGEKGACSCPKKSETAPAD